MKNLTLFIFLLFLSFADLFAQPKAKPEEAFWNKADFWESPALKTPYREDLSEDEKIAGLSKFWSEVKYNFINFHLVPELDWDKTYLEFLPKVRRTRSTLEYYKVLEEFCARLKDGHTLILPPDELADAINARPLLITHLIEDRVVVTELLDEKLLADGIEKGIEVTAIDGVPVKKYAAERIIPYSSDSTPQARNLSVYSRRLLAGPKEKTVNLTFRDETGKTFERSLPRISWSEWRKLLPAQKPFEMRALDGGVMYIKINTFMNNTPAEEFAKNFDEIAKSAAIIFDIRDNGGGNSNVGWEILSYLTAGNFKTSRWRTREYHPSFRAWQREEFGYGEEAGEYKKEVKKTFSKPVIVLTSPRTGSAAEDFSVAFRAAKRGLIIGEPTNGSTGQPLLISLPGGGRAGICTKYDSFPDGTAFVGVGVVPDIIIPKKVSDLAGGNDTVLKAALEELRSK